MKIWLGQYLQGEYDDFMLYENNEGVHCFWSTLAGITIQNLRPAKVFPVYKAAIAVQSRPGQIMVEFWAFGKQVRLFLAEKRPHFSIEIGEEEVIDD